MTEILEYSTCPLDTLNFSNIGDIGRREFRRFGLEVEVGDWCEEDQQEADGKWLRATSCAHPAQHSLADAYCIPCEDSSIQGEAAAELKTPPFTKSDHWLFHAMYHSEPPPRTTHPATQCKWLRGVRRRWFPNAMSWCKASCGMHITVDISTATSATWSKLYAWLNRGSSEQRQEVLFLRRPNSYCLASAETTILSYNKAAQEGDKYDILHIKNWLAEFRGFQSSTNPLTIMRNVDVVDSLLDWMTTVPLYAVESVGLRQYGAWLRTQPGRYPYLCDWIVRRAAPSTLTEGYQDVYRYLQTA